MEESTESTETVGGYAAMHPVPVIGGATLLGVLGGYLSRRLYRKGPKPMVIGGLLGATVGTIAQYFAWKSTYKSQIALNPDMGFFQREPLKGIVRLGALQRQARWFTVATLTETEALRIKHMPVRTVRNAVQSELPACFPVWTQPHYLSHALVQGADAVSDPFNTRDLRRYEFRIRVKFNTEGALGTRDFANMERCLHSAL